MTEFVDAALPAQEMRRWCVEGGADAASMTFGKATLVVTATTAKLLSPETGPVDIDLGAA